jgi:sugar phosphate isomerase/epimerase
MRANASSGGMGSFGGAPGRRARAGDPAIDAARAKAAVSRANASTQSARSQGVGLSATQSYYDLVTTLRAPRPLLAFSTLGCPEWSPEQVVRRAARYGYDAIEWRGGPDGHVRVDRPADRPAALRRLMDDHGLVALAVTAYSSFAGPPERRETEGVDQLRRHIDLAADLGAGTVRAFLGEIEDDTAPADVLGWAIEGLGRIVDHARQAGVTLGIEPHDDFVRCASIAPLLDALDPTVVGVVWDPVNAWGAGESPADGFAIVGGRIRYMQLKDARWIDGAWRLEPLGLGDAPLEAIVEILLRSGRPLPAMCFEWERAWHPDLDPPEVALPHALAVMEGMMTDHRAEDGSIDRPSP